MDVPLSNLFLNDKVTRDYIAKLDMVIAGKLVPTGTAIPYDVEFVGTRQLNDCMDCIADVDLTEEGNVRVIKSIKCPEQPKEEYRDTPKP